MPQFSKGFLQYPIMTVIKIHYMLITTNLVLTTAKIKIACKLPVVNAW